MAKIDEVKAQLDAAGIPYADSATLPQLKALLPKDESKEAVAEEADFTFAVNQNKLLRAKVWVKQQADLNKTEVPTGDAFVTAVKERYQDMGGLLRGYENKNRTPKKGGKVVNIAPDDGSKY